MKHRAWHRFISVIAAAIFLMIAQAEARSSEAPERPTGRSAGLENRLTRELSLTSEQAARLKENRAEQRRKMEAIRSALKKQRELLKEELDKPDATRERVEPIAAELKSLQAEMVDQRISSIFTVRGILTPEQFAKFKTLAAQKSGKRGFRQRGAQDQPAQ